MAKGTTLRHSQTTHAAKLYWNIIIFIIIIIIIIIIYYLFFTIGSKDPEC